MTNLEVIETWMHKVWQEQDRNTIFEMFIPDGSASGMGESVMGPEQFAAFHEMLLQLIEDIEIHVVKHFEQEEWSSSLCHMKFRAKNDPETLHEITGTAIVKIREGKIIEAYNHFDFLSLFESIGLLPKDTFMQCLSGKKPIAAQSPIDPIPG